MLELFHKKSKSSTKHEEVSIPISVHDGILKIMDHFSILLDQVVGVSVTFRPSIAMDDHYMVWLITHSGEVCAASLNVLKYHDAALLARQIKDAIETLLSTKQQDE